MCDKPKSVFDKKWVCLSFENYCTGGDRFFFFLSFFLFKFSSSLNRTGQNGTRLSGPNPAVALNSKYIISGGFFPALSIKQVSAFFVHNKHSVGKRISWRYRPAGIVRSISIRPPQTFHPVNWSDNCVPSDNFFVVVLVLLISCIISAPGHFRSTLERSQLDPGGAQ